jgi:MSHA biogenesis protein MshP
MTRIVSVRRKQEHGFALVAAIFIVVVLALLGIMMVTIGGLQRATATTAMRGTQAYFASRSGVEWGIFGALNNTVATCGNAPSTPTTNTFTLAVPGLNDYIVSVGCEYTTHREQSDTYNVYVITSTATSGAFGNMDYVSRILRVSVTDAPAP